MNITELLSDNAQLYSIGRQAKDIDLHVDTLLYQKIKTIKIVSTILLSLLTFTSFLLSILCSVLYSTPSFLILMVISVVCSLFTLAFKNFFQITKDNWGSLLNTHFQKLPAITAENTFETFGNHFSFWQHRANLNIYLALPRYTDEFSYSFLSPIVYRAALSDTSYPKFLVNPIHPNQQHTNPSSKSIYDFITNKSLQDKEIPIPCVENDTFLPTETRISTVTKLQNMTELETRKCPHFLIHTRGPMLREFSGSKQEIMHQYYLRALISYKKILHKAVGTRRLHTISIPIFSFVYDRDDHFTTIDRMTAEKLCLSALVQAMNSLAHTQPGKLLVCVQLISSK